MLSDVAIGRIEKLLASGDDGPTVRFGPRHDLEQALVGHGRSNQILLGFRQIAGFDDRMHSAPRTVGMMRRATPSIQSLRHARPAKSAKQVSRRCRDAPGWRSEER